MKNGGFAFLAGLTTSHKTQNRSHPLEGSGGRGREPATSTIRGWRWPNSDVGKETTSTRLTAVVNITRKD